MPQPATGSNDILLEKPAESGNTAAWNSRNAFAGFVMPQPATGFVMPQPATAFVMPQPATAFGMPQSATVSFPEAIRSNETSLENRIKLPPSTESDFVVKMKKLNSSVLSWMNRQIVDQPLSIWKDGLKVVHCVCNSLMCTVFVFDSFNLVLPGLRSLLDRNLRKVRIRGK